MLFPSSLIYWYLHNIGPLKPQDQTLPPVYCSIMDASIFQMISTCDIESSPTITTLLQQTTWGLSQQAEVCVLSIGGLGWLPSS